MRPSLPSATISSGAGLGAFLADTPWWLVFLVVIFTAAALPAASEFRTWRSQKSAQELEYAEMEIRREQHRRLLALQRRAERAIQDLPPGADKVTAYLELFARSKDALQPPHPVSDADEGREASP
ncbi:hypothetical protein ACFCXF_11050 [Streptomyces virginiae]|uniref:hypothetical protein n=1 Tax=Streptomyces TaxID=1883 RepID=UPI0035D54E1E